MKDETCSDLIKMAIVEKIHMRDRRAGSIGNDVMRQCSGDRHSLIACSVIAVCDAGLQSFHFGGECIIELFADCCHRAIERPRLSADLVGCVGIWERRIVDAMPVGMGSLVIVGPLEKVNVDL